MLVESWGEKADTLDAMGRDIRTQGFQRVFYGFTSYRGATLSGEFRELCGRYVQLTDGLVQAAKDLECAPQYLSNKGYQTIGVHGYQASFYARDTFWARFGIKNQIFADKLRDQSQCAGAFPGVCDENLIRKSLDVLDGAAKPAFVYILTLSSHEPLDPAALESRGRYFNELRIDHPTQVVTRRAISALVARLQERHAAGCTLVYLAGDHQPPSASAQGNIFMPGKVPYLTFTQNCPTN
jgi:phosphoglycerol transferase MdoB-like AlkP superfamily enzyme